MADETFDRRYASIDQFHALDTRVAVIEKDISNKLENITKQNERIEARMSAPPAAPATTGADQLLLLGHRVMDKFDKMPAPRGGPSWLVVVAMGAAILFLGYRAVIGHW